VTIESVAEPLRKKTVGWALVGLGTYARGRMLPALRRADGTRVVGVYTRTRAVSAEVAREYGARDYGSLATALADPEVDLVYLATPHDLHAAQALTCAAAGKHILVEKPMALSVGEATAMVEACDRAGVRLFVGFQWRHHPAHQRARALVTAGEIGEVVWASARWTAYRPADTGWRVDPGRSGGTLLTARGVHLIDLIRFITSTEYVAVSGMSDGLQPHHPADDVTVGLLQLKSGGFADLLCTRLVPGAEDGVEIRGTRGMIVCRFTVGAEGAGVMVFRNGSREDTMAVEAGDVLRAQIESVNAAVRGGSEPSGTATGRDGARVVAVASALIDSVRSGRLVSLPH
jgi:1,5-anhydro-D-fructose reductase (1,5-anhydro-D-mannitol-forming)